MARPRKTTPQVQSEEEKMLSTEELVEVLKFAAQIYNTDPYGYFTPSMNNQNIIDLNNNPQVPTKEKVTAFLKKEDIETNCLINNPVSRDCDLLFKNAIEYALELKVKEDKNNVK